MTNIQLKNLIESTIKCVSALNFTRHLHNKFVKIMMRKIKLSLFEDCHTICSQKIHPRSKSENITHEKPLQSYHVFCTIIANYNG